MAHRRVSKCSSKVDKLSRLYKSCPPQPNLQKLDPFIFLHWSIINHIDVASTLLTLYQPLWQCINQIDGSSVKSRFGLHLWSTSLPLINATRCVLCHHFCRMIIFDVPRHWLHSVFSLLTCMYSYIYVVVKLAIDRIWQVFNLASFELHLWSEALTSHCWSLNILFGALADVTACHLWSLLFDCVCSEKL